MEQLTQEGPDFPGGLVIRHARPQDAPRLERLAQRDSAPPLSGTALVAEQDGVPLAAISLASGDVVADPFRHTAGIVSMLTLSRRHLTERVPARSMRRFSLGRRARAGLAGTSA